LAIHPFYQKQGLGSRLMEVGLNRAKALGYKGVVIWGDPQYYSKFGFVKGQDVGISTSDGTFNDAVLCKALEEGFFNVVKGRFIELHDLNIVKEDVIRYDQDFLKKRSMTSQTQG
jgi:predicted N-acetyltransferase YhbS